MTDAEMETWMEEMKARAEGRYEIVPPKYVPRRTVTIHQPVRKVSTEPYPFIDIESETLIADAIARTNARAGVTSV
jgi:hypothetical protein